MNLSEKAYRDMWRLKEDGQGGGLIVVCGFDGSGKTTQVGLLAQKLEMLGRRVILTRQPTDWYRSLPALRAYIDGGKPVDQLYLALLAAADRRRHIVEEIDPAIQAGAWVICDRYVFSSLAYFAERGVSPGVVARLNLDIPRPSLAVLLDVPPETIIARIAERDGGVKKYEERDIDKVARIRRNFLDLAALDPQILVVDGQQTPSSIHAAIMNRLALPLLS